MNALFYLLGRKYLNMVKRLFRKPFAAVLTVIFLLCMIIPMVMSLVFNTAHGVPKTLDIAVGGGTLLFGYFILFILLSQNSGLFYLSDVNILFTSPISEKKNLVYAMLNIFASSLLVSIFALVWIPLIVGKGLPWYSYFSAGVSFVLMLPSIMLSYMLCYLKNIQKPGFTKKIRTITLIAILSIFGIFAVLYIINSYDAKKAAQILFSSMPYHLLPIFGWSQWGMVSALRNNYLSGWIPSILLFLAADTLLVYIIFGLKVDYYEQAQSDAERSQSIRDRARTGKVDLNSFYAKKVNKASGDFSIGARSIWSRHLLEFKKTGINMGNINSFISIAYVIIFSLLKLELNVIVSMVIFVTIFTGINDSWNSDFKKPFIYLIPDNSMKKAFYATLFSLVKTWITGAISFMLLGFFNLSHAVDIVFLYFVFASYAAVGLYTIVFAQRILGSQSNIFAVNMLRMLFMLVAAIPSGIIITVFHIIFNGQSLLLTYIPVIILNFGLAILLLYLSRRLFEVAELMD